MRLLLFTGKGGVGTTTIAAATAVHGARCGRKTLLLTAADGPALADVLQVGVPTRPSEVSPGLAVLRLDARQRMASSWPRLAGPFAAALSGLAADRQAAEDLTALPGVAATIGLLELRDQVRADLWDLVVVDCPAVAQTLRWLAAPDAVARWLELVLPVEQRVHRAIAIGSRPAGSAPEPADPPVDGLAAGLDRLAAELADARAVLTGPECSVMLVSTPAATALEQARRAWTGLGLYGLRVAAAVAVRADAEGAARVGQALPGLPVWTVPELPEEPLGLDALAGLAAAVHGPATGDPAWLTGLQDPSMQAGPQVRRTGTGFELTLRLPLADRSELELSRQGDDLIVQLAAHRRVIRLASALRRCRVSGARLRDDVLTVSFRPDERLWPAT